MRHRGDEALEHSVTHAHSQCSASQSENQALCNELGEDGPPACTECTANGQFLLADHTARQQKIGDVHACNQQHEPNCSQKQPEHLYTFFGQKIVLQVLHVGSPPRIALWIHL